MFFHKTFDRQLENRPSSVVFCKRCVVSNQRPRITFDSEGICSACRYAELKKNEINWKKREEMLLILLEAHRSKDGYYDCIVPVSGGKDSGYVAHQLKYVYGMHPLTITWAPFIYTDIGFKNYLSFKDSGFDNIIFFQNGVIHRKLARLAFELLGDPWEPFSYGQKSYAYHISMKFNIPLIFYGESGEVEYGGSTKNMYKPFESPDDYKKLYYKDSGIDELTTYGLEKGIFSKNEIKDKTLEIYKIPPLDEMKKVNPEMHWFSFYKKWIPQENYYYAAEHTGFHANPIRSEGTYSKYASLDDKLDGFHYYLAFIKFGIGRATSDAAHEIRDNHLVREEGVALVKRYDGEFPKKYFQEFLEYLSMTEPEFWEVIDFYRTLSPHLWQKTNKKWKLKHQIV